MASKIRNVLVHLAPLRRASGVEVHLHATTLYNSLYWFDEEMLVNTHVYGLPAGHAPVLHLRRLSAGELFDTYAESFERVWALPAVWASREAAAWPRRALQRPGRPRGQQHRGRGDRLCAGRRRRVLLIRRTTTTYGRCRVAGRTSASTSPRPSSARRKEESGIDVEVTGFIGVYTNPNHVVEYSDGEVRQQFSLCFRARPAAHHA